MPWDCKQCQTSLSDDVTTCPQCGVDKTSWTMEADVTRAFVLAAKLRCLACDPDREGELRVRLELDPRDPLTADDTFTLFSRGGELAAQVKTTADDQSPDDAYVDLCFSGLDRGLRYSLQVDAGHGDRYLAFDDVPYAELAGPGAPPFAPTWRAVDRVRAVDKGTLRDLARRGVAPALERLLLVRATGGATAATVTVLFDTQLEQVHEAALDERGELRLLFAFGAGGLEGIAFDGVQVVDVSEDTEEGHAPKVQVGVQGQAPRALTLEAPGARLRCRLEIDPHDPLSADDRFVLTSPHGEFHEQVRTIADDLTPDDDTTDLLFVGLDEALSYTLTVYPAGDAPGYAVFEERPYAELVSEAGAAGA